MNKLFLFIGLGLIFLVLFALILSFAFSSVFLGSGEIAVIQIKGDISSSQDSFSFSSTSKNIAEKIKEADKDPFIKAIFLDIDSPGGTVVATKEIVFAVRKAEKPVVAYIGEAGASGAYYIAAASDLIIADTDSLTGSIGVISVSANLEGLMEKLGIKMKILKEGEFKDMGSPFKELTEEEEQILNEIIFQASDNFKQDILEFRKDKLTEEKFNSVADGRILSGKQAKELGLIDLTASREQAIQKTAELAGIIGEPTLKEFTEPEADLLSLMTKAGYSFGTGFISAVRSNQPEFDLQAK